MLNRLLTINLFYLLLFGVVQADINEYEPFNQTSSFVYDESRSMYENFASHKRGKGSQDGVDKRVSFMYQCRAGITSVRGGMLGMKAKGVDITRLPTEVTWVKGRNAIVMALKTCEQHYPDLERAKKVANKLAYDTYKANVAAYIEKFGDPFDSLADFD